MLLSRRRLLVAGSAALVTAACRPGSNPPGSSSRLASTTASTGAGAADATVRTTLGLPPVRSLEAQIADFLAAPELNGASLLAIAMGQSGDVQWVPYLLDLLRLAGDDLAAGHVMVALQTLTGRYVLDDTAVAFVEYGGWMLERQLEPAPGYQRWKITLYRRIDPAYEAMLGTIADVRLLSEIHWGGVLPGGIPELQRPAREPNGGSAAVALTNEELVFGFVVDDIAVAYPERVLGYHELANDVVGSTEVIVSYCPLCRSARVVRAEGRTMRSSGLLRRSNKLMQQVGADVLWQQMSGTALNGPEQGTVLTQVTVETTTWKDWRGRHPSTEVVATPDPAQFPSTSYRYLPLDAYASYDRDGGAWSPVLVPPRGLPLKATVVGVRSADGAALAVDVAAIGRSGPTLIAWSGGAVTAVVAAPGPGGARIYDATTVTARVPGPVTLRNSDHEIAVLDDGTVLPAMPTDRAYWFAWYGEHRTSSWWPR